MCSNVFLIDVATLINLARAQFYGPKSGAVWQVSTNCRNYPYDSVNKDAPVLQPSF